MNNFVAVVGMPGTGKTHLLSTFMNGFLEWKEERPIELLDSHFNETHSIRVLGRYDDSVFSGTDRLSMAVQPKVIEYITSKPREHIVFEGDRLTSVNFFNEVKKYFNLHILVLEVDDETRELRYKERGSDQNRKFIEGRKTKIENIKNAFGEKVLTGDPALYKTFQHKNKEDTYAIIDELENLLCVI